MSTAAPAPDATPEAPAPATTADLAATNATLAELTRTLKESVARQAAAPPQPAPAPAPEPRRRVTPAELMAAVDRNEITLAQALAAQEAQLRVDMGEEIKRATQLAAQETQVVSRTQAAIDKLIVEFPDFAKPGTDLCGEYNLELAELMTHGAPNTLATQLAAARVVAQRHRKPTPEPEETTTQTSRSQEVLTPSAGGGAAPRTRDRSVWAGIPADAREQYEKLLKRGFWKGESDPKFKAALDALRGRLGRRQVVVAR